MPFSESTEPVPATLRTDEFVLRPIEPGDTEMDYAAVMDTRESLRRWRQSTWPEDDFTVEANRRDVITMVERHAAHRAFNYTLLDPEGNSCLGCVYVFPTDATFLAKAEVTPLGEEEWEDVGAVVYFWVRASRIVTGMDDRLLAALRRWFTDTWKLRAVYVASEQFSEQVALIARTDLSLKFELQEPTKPYKHFVFG